MAFPDGVPPAGEHAERCAQEAYQETLHRGMQLLAGRPHSCRELSNKLCAKGLESRSVDAVVNRLVELGLLNDVAFAEGRLNRLLATGRSAGLAREDLLSKGVPRDVVESVLSVAASPESEEERALALARRRAVLCKHLPPDRAAARVIRHLWSKGYSPGVARKASQTVFRASGEPEGD